jgi:hypothetical protein
LSTPGSEFRISSGTEVAEAFGPTLLGGPVMSDPVESLIVDLLEWIGRAPRPYAEVMEAWRTSCPRLPVWEEANARGFIEQRHAAGTGAIVLVSPAGLRHLELRRPPLSASASSAGAAQ